MQSGRLQQIRITARGKAGVRENLAEGRDLSSVENLHAIAQGILETNKAFSSFLGLERQPTSTDWLTLKSEGDLPGGPE